MTAKPDLKPDLDFAPIAKRIRDVFCVIDGVAHRNGIGLDCDARRKRAGQNSKPGLIGRA
jgi:hypothetical protein